MYKVSRLVISIIRRRDWLWKPSYRGVCFRSLKRCSRSRIVHKYRETEVVEEEGMERERERERMKMYILCCLRIGLHNNCIIIYVFDFKCYQIVF